MALDIHEPRGEADPHAAADPPRRPHAHSSVPARLVLFVGKPPNADVCELLAQDGMRSLCLGGPAQALRAATLACFDALVIDAAQLGSRAATWLAALRAQLGCPLVVVAEHADEIDEILALEVGADAYLARPVAPRRLRAHLAALLRAAAVVEAPRRMAATRGSTAAVQTIGGCRLDRVAHRLSVDGRTISITDVQGALLQCLFDACGRIVPRASLAATLPGGRELSARSVDVYIHRLRKQLQRQGLEDRLPIEAVRGRGYRLAAVAESHTEALG